MRSQDTHREMGFPEHDRSDWIKMILNSSGVRHFAVAVFFSVSAVYAPVSECLADTARTHLDSAQRDYTAWSRDNNASELDAALSELMEARAAEPTNPDVMQWIGFIQLKLGHYAESLQALQELDRRVPGIPATSVNIGDAYLGLGRNDDAIAAFDRAIRALTSGSDQGGKRGKAPQLSSSAQISSLQYAYYDMGTAYLHEDRPQNAVSAFRQALDVSAQRSARPDPTAPASVPTAEIENGLGSALQAGGSLADAATAYRRSTEMAPSDPTYWLHLGRVEAVIAGGYPAASAERRSGLVQAADALSHASKVSEDCHTQEEYAGLLVDLEQDTQAISLFDRADKLREIRQSGPAGIGTLVKRGIAEARLERLDAAAKIFTAATASDPRNALALRWLGYVYMKEKKYREAAAPLEASIALDGSQRAANVDLGQVYMRLERYAEAVERFHLATEAAPVSADAFYQLGDALLHLQRFTDADAAYHRAVSLDAVSAGSAGVIAYARLGAALAAAKNDGGAADAYGKAVQLAPGNYEVRESYAQELVRLNQNAAASVQFEKAAALDPHPRNALYFLGITRYRQGQATRAEDAFHSALDAHPDDLEALQQLGQLQKELERYEVAAQTFEQIIRLSPEDIDAYLMRYDCLKNTGDMRSAVATLESATRISPKPDSVSARSGLAQARRLLAQFYLNRGGLSDAEEQYRLSLSDESDLTCRAEAFNDLGIVALRRGRQEKTVAYDRMLIHRTGDLAGKLAAARSQVKGADRCFITAIDYFKKALNSRPNYADAYDNLGASYELMGDLKQALWNYGRALEIDPHSLPTRQNLARLKQLVGLLSPSR